MKRILINDSIIKLSEEYKKNLFNKPRTTFKKPINDDGVSGKLFDLKNHLKNLKHLKLADYVSNIINHYDKIIVLQPSKFGSYFKSYFNLDEDNLNKEVSELNDKSKKINFHKLVVEAMRYDAVRSLYFLPFVKKLGIKACVYCNTQFAITTEKEDNKLSGKFELDHFYPKSKYPFLATSFFNLQPCCSHCNKTKSDRDATFNLYTDDHTDTSINPFSFSLDRQSILYYLLNKKEDELEILLNCTDSDLKQNHEELFHITAVYEQHKDIAEELLWKAKVYNKSYKDTLRKSFSSIFPNDSSFNRFLLLNHQVFSF